MGSILVAVTELLIIKNVLHLMCNREGCFMRSTVSTKSVLPRILTVALCKSLNAYLLINKFITSLCSQELPVSKMSSEWDVRIMFRHLKRCSNNIDLEHRVLTQKSGIVLIILVWKILQIFLTFNICNMCHLYSHSAP